MEPEVQRPCTGQHTWWDPRLLVGQLVRLPVRLLVKWHRWKMAGWLVLPGWIPIIQLKCILNSVSSIQFVPANFKLAFIPVYSLLRRFLYIFLIRFKGLSLLTLNSVLRATHFKALINPLPHAHVAGRKRSSAGCLNNVSGQRGRGGERPRRPEPPRFIHHAAPPAPGINKDLMG